ncbi:uncharacterized protein LOC126585081 [Malus sylvestris]|uniref:uncharacterized protein LOC126585081 n=1 Tax=Malus sylvestris TaxID=3752 RepID=UPI0021ABF85F|nr:uncharacterized protein LOC126585081 [Malus sylvestris]XP_050105438.1 uncharacterized protein LOC126585081 [Malus sylvestris]XP_050105439.1 uncharacterized protein LOC126585081 [Malus sylvestris]
MCCECLQMCFNVEVDLKVCRGLVGSTYKRRYTSSKITGKKCVIVCKALTKERNIITAEYGMPKNPLNQLHININSINGVLPIQFARKLLKMLKEKKRSEILFGFYTLENVPFLCIFDFYEVK